MTASGRARRRRRATGLSLVSGVALLASSTGCAGTTESTSTTLRLEPVGTTLVIGDVTTAPPTTPPITEPPTTVPPVPAYVPTDGLRRLEAAGVPELAARAYLNASQRAPEALPNCKMPPEVLAAFGAAESRHGDVGQFDEDGTSRDIIRGYASVGDDTDGGVLDGDTEKDWAVGPMQFIPSTWKDLQRDGNDDGFLDPSNFYDAALATTAYLCHLAGPFPDVTYIAGQRNQWEKDKAAKKQKFDAQHDQWEKDKKRRADLEDFIATHPNDTTDVSVLNALPPLTAEPEYEDPPLPAGPAQLRTGIERYYGPEGETRDNYRDDLETHFRNIVGVTGGVKVTPEDRLR